MQLLEDRVLVRLEEVSSTTEGGIVLPNPQNFVNGPRQATVLEVGDGRYLPNGDFIDVAVSANDKVILSNYSGTEIELPEYGKCVVVRESDILLIL